MPLELWEKALDWLPRDAIGALKAVSETSVQLCLPARKRLFRELPLDHPGHVTEIVTLLSWTPQLALAVYTLDLWWGEQASDTMETVLGVCSVAEKLSTLLEMCQNVRKVKVLYRKLKFGRI